MTLICSMIYAAVRRILVPMSYIPWLLFEKTVPGVQENGARDSVSGGSAPSIRSVPGGLRAKTLWDPGPNIDID